MEENNQTDPQEQPEKTPAEEPSMSDSLFNSISEPSTEDEQSTQPEPAEEKDMPEPVPDEKYGEETETKPEPTKFQRFLRQALIWLGVIVGGFLAGFLTFYFTLYRPQTAKVEQLETTNEGLQSQITTMETDKEQLEEQLAELEDAQFHSTLLDVMTDVYTARLALTVEDTLAAKSALRNTASKLETIEDELADFDTALANGLPQRLSLIQNNIDRDVEKAIADSDLLIDDLQEVESALFP